jgi:ribosomal subunit interface protein
VGRTALADNAVAIKDLAELEVVIHDRAQSLPTEIREYVEKKVMGLADHFDLITTAEVEFDRDLKRRPEPLHVVKVTLHVLGHRMPELRVHETGRDIRTTFDVAMDKIDGEVTQLKERVRAH